MKQRFTLGACAVLSLPLCASAQARYFVSDNGPLNAGLVESVTPSLAPSGSFAVGNNQGVTVDVDGTVYQAGDTGAPLVPGSIRIVNVLRERNAGGFTPLQDRMIGGAGTSLTGLVNPKGIDLAYTAGYILVADNGDSSVRVFGSAASGDVPPVATTPLTVAPWDLDYDQDNDRLFVSLTDGTVAVFDSYISGSFGAGGPARITFPADVSGNPLSTQLHGIDYLASYDILAISDVGATSPAQSANWDRDGFVYMLPGASSASGGVLPIRSFGGNRTLLGNPVDIYMDKRRFVVAEQANNAILAFRWDTQDGNTPPAEMHPHTSPESIVRNLLHADAALDVTDIDRPEPLASVLVTSNPADPTSPSVGMFAHLDPAQLTQLSVFDSNESLENAMVSSSGDAFVSIDSGINTHGGIRVVGRLGVEGQRTAGLDPARDRLIQGPSTGLISPKGIEYVRSAGLIMVAENNAVSPAVLAFGSDAEGDVPPMFRVDDLGNTQVRPWDLDYDLRRDRLYVACTNGTVAVFDNFLLNQGAFGPDRVILPFDPSRTQRVAVNLHGIVHQRMGDRLILSDVGSATNPADGQIFVIQNASSAQGPTAVELQLLGPASRLGNPVDISFDGANLFVAEKAGNQVLRFDGILGLSGVQDTAPTLSMAFTAPESITVIPTFVGRQPQIY